MPTKKPAKKPAAKKPKVTKSPGRVTTKSRWTAPGAKARAADAKRATKAPKQEPLIKGLRIRALDNICGHISDTRAAIARLQGEEADIERQAHALMRRHDQTSWQSSGVILVRVPGEEKLTVKTVRSRGPAPSAEPETMQTPERASAVDADDNLDADDQGIHGAND